MLQSLLKKIFCDNLSVDMDKLAEFLELYEVNDYIYPSALKKYLNLSTEKTYEVLSLLEKEQILKMVFFVECFDCNRKVNEYDELWKIKNDVCDECENKLIFPNNVKVVYKVVMEWKI
ncbi:MAG: hypothetical protein J6C28_03100 [Bacilli bacterium]|nr:hypothetical protein [Bacilli bacterium]